MKWTEKAVVTLTPPAIMRFNVIDYGADGTGQLDTTADVQHAVNAAVAAGGGEVWFPKGTYRIDRIVACGGSSYLTFRGEGRGSVISKGATATDRTAFRFSRLGAKLVGIEVASLAFVSDRSTTVADAGILDFAVGTEDFEDVCVRECHFAMPRDHSVAMLFSVGSKRTMANVRVVENTFDGCPYSAIAFNNSYSTDYRITGLRVSRNYIRNGGSLPITVAGPIAGISIDQNYIESATSTYGIEIVGPQGCTISGNVFKGTFTTAVIGSSGSTSNPVGQDVLIEGNVSVGMLTGGFVFQNLTRCLIQNNQFRYSGTMAFSGVGNGCEVSLIDNWLDAATPFNAFGGASLFHSGNRFGTSTPLGNPWRAAVDTGAGSGTSRATVLFAGPGLSSWRPVALRVRVSQVAGNGGSAGYGERIFMIRLLNNTTAVSAVSSAVLESGLALTLAPGINTCTITAAGSGGASNVRHLWAIEYDDGAGANVVSIALSAQ